MRALVVVLFWGAMIFHGPVFAAENSGKDLGDILGGIFKRTSSGGLKSSGLSTEEMNAAIKEALGQGLRAAVAQLGRTNGFLTNLQVRIAMPEQLRTVERGLKAVGQGALVTDFETALNRAAEQAVPAATDVFLATLKEMTVADAKDLLTSKSSTAVTQFFREKSERELSRRFLPIVQEWTGKAGVTAAYKDILQRGGGTRFGFLFNKTVDIDSYVTGKALDGLFLVVAEEEKRIRENPQARATELLQKVFGAMQTETSAR